MDENTMYWLFTTAPQAIAALVGIIFTRMFFMAESVDNRTKEEPSMLEVWKRYEVSFATRKFGLFKKS